MSNHHDDFNKCNYFHYIICDVYESHPSRHGYPPSGLRIPGPELRASCTGRYRANQKKSVFPIHSKPFLAYRTLQEMFIYLSVKWLHSPSHWLDPFWQPIAVLCWREEGGKILTILVGKYHNFWNTLYLLFLILKIQSQKNNSQSKTDKERTYWPSCMSHYDLQRVILKNEALRQPLKQSRCKLKLKWMIFRRSFLLVTLLEV